MIKYKVVIADDEREIFGRLEKFLNCTDDFEIVGSAGNGYDAYHLVETLQPDILITDIIMPFISGIELVKMVKENYPLVKTAIVSGANNFEYTKEAMDLNVVGYLTKPVDKEAVKKLLDKIRKVFASQEQAFKIDNLRKKYESSVENAIENVLAINMLGGLKKSSYEQLSEFGFSFENKTYALAFVTPYKNEINKPKFKENYHLIKHIAQDILIKHFEVRVVMFEDGIVFVLLDNLGNFSQKISSAFYEIIKIIERKLKTELLVSISKEYVDFTRFHDAYLDTQNIIFSERLVDFGNIILSSDVIEDDVDKLYMLESDILEIEKCIRMGSKEEMQKLFDSLEEKLFSSKKHLSQEYLCINLSNVFIKYARDCNVIITDIVSSNLYTEFMEFKSSGKLFKHFIKLVGIVQQKSVESKITNSEKILKDAVEYIEENYQKSELSLEMVCYKIGVSISYLSMLFKKKKDINFIKYLINYRMEMAKKLLRETDLKVIEVSIKCGYSNVYYFSHSFKKHTNMTAGEYRAHENN